MRRALLRVRLLTYLLPLQVLKHESAMLLRIGEHPNIVRHQGFYVGSSQVALCLELVSGGDCQQLLQRQGCLAEAPLICAIIGCGGKAG